MNDSVAQMVFSRAGLIAALAIALFFGSVSARGPSPALAAPARNQSPTPSPIACVDPQGCPIPVTYAAGWNIVANTASIPVTGNDGPLYTWQAGDDHYEQVPHGTPLQVGVGYWAYFDRPTQSDVITEGVCPLPMPGLSCNFATPFSLTLPAGQFILIGNPFSSTATVSGADLVLTYDTALGYVATTMLNKGQGAWAYSAAGGTITLEER